MVAQGYRPLGCGAELRKHVTRELSAMLARFLGPRNDAPTGAERTEG